MIEKEDNTLPGEVYDLIALKAVQDDDLACRSMLDRFERRQDSLWQEGDVALDPASQNIWVAFIKKPSCELYLQQIFANGTLGEKYTVGDSHTPNFSNCILLVRAANIVKNPQYFSLLALAQSQGFSLSTPEIIKAD